MHHRSTFLLAALGLICPAASAANNVQKTLLFRTGDAVPGVGTVIGVADNIGASVATGPNGLQRRGCFGLRTEEGRTPLVTYDFDSLAYNVQYDETTLFDSGDVMRVQLSCDLNVTGAVTSGLLGDFVTQAYAMQVFAADGGPDGAPQLILQSGDPLPNGAAMSFAEPPVVASAGFAFRNDAAGLYYYHLEYETLDTIADTNTLMPGTAATIGSFSEPAIGELNVSFQAFALGVGSLQLSYEYSTQVLQDEAVAVGSRPFATWDGTQDVYTWHESGPTFEGRIVRLGGGLTDEFVAGGIEFSDGTDTAEIILAQEFAQIQLSNFRGPGAGGLCVGYRATLASDPSNQAHLVRTCETAPGQLETTLLLSPGEVVDGSTVASWFVRPEAASGNVVLIVLNFTDNGRGVLLIEGAAGAPDSDGDGVADDADNCLATVNPNQRDTDSDNIGNACDGDLNNDCIVNVQDLGLLRTVFFSGDAEADFNGDGIVNVVDLGLLRTFFFGVPGPSGLANACASR